MISKEDFNRILQSDGQRFCDTELLNELFFEGGVETINGLQIYFSDLTEKELSDWNELDYWLDEYGLYSYELIGNDDLDYDTSKPADYFESVESVKSAVVDYLLSREDSENKFGFYFISVEFEKQKIYLIIGSGHWVDGWSLGHGDCADVVSDMDAYISDPENGIYLAKE